MLRTDQLDAHDNFATKQIKGSMNLTRHFWGEWILILQGLGEWN
jgi:hypothetical protein